MMLIRDGRITVLYVASCGHAMRNFFHDPLKADSCENAEESKCNKNLRGKSREDARLNETG
jgi:hypothetical protein